MDLHLEEGGTFVAAWGARFTFRALVRRGGEWLVEATRPCEGEPDEVHLLRLSELR